ncbi:hypothetical protein KC930_01465 [Candidatus Saccharibacteria bacterium]|nr:hypothetical protein [Candidatus Saccharibacteria bacterium]
MTHESKPLGGDDEAAEISIVSKYLPNLGADQVPLSYEQARAMMSMLCFTNAVRKADEMRQHLDEFQDSLANQGAHSNILEDIEDIVEGPEWHIETFSPGFVISGVGDGDELQILEINNIVKNEGTVGVWLYMHPKEETEDVLEKMYMVLLVPEMPSLILTKSGLDSIQHSQVGDFNVPEAIAYYHSQVGTSSGVDMLTPQQMSEIHDALDELEIDMTSYS